MQESSIIYQEMRSDSGWIIGFGVLTVILGAFCIFVPMSTAVGAAIVAGWALFFSGFISIVNAFQKSGAWNKVVNVLWGVLGIIAGLILFAEPLSGAVSIAMVGTAYLLARGIVTLLSLSSFPLGKGWAALMAILDIVLGVLLMMGGLGEATLVLGYYIAISLVFSGATQIALGTRLRSAT